MPPTKAVYKVKAANTNSPTRVARAMNIMARKILPMPDNAGMAI
jgi:hypothetical protein